MTEPTRPTILCVDDDEDIRDWMEAVLTGRGWDVINAGGGKMALQVAQKRPPDLIVLDVTMPDMSGYEVCAKLQEQPTTANIPVIFATSRASEEDKVRAFQAGAADYLVKPLNERSLSAMVDLHLVTSRKWKGIASAPSTDRVAETKIEGTRWDARLKPSEFTRFKEYLGGRLNMLPETRAALARFSTLELYAQAPLLRVPERAIAEALAQFLSIPFQDRVDPKGVKLGVLPAPFCKSNGIVPIVLEGNALSFVVTNPFIWQVQEAIKQVLGRNETPSFVVAEPSVIEKLLQPVAAPAPAPRKTSISELEARIKEEMVPVGVTEAREVSDNENSAPIIQLVNSLIEAAYQQGASDIHLEPAEEEVVVRYRIDGDLRIVNRLKPARLIHPMIARLKIMANLNIAEHRLPQDGRIVFKQFSKSSPDFDLRLAIAPMNHGEKAVLRILDKQKSVLPLADLGFSNRNLELYRSKIRAPYGMVLHVGPTGSGKSMTLYAALNEIKDPTINIQTAEDPIEYTLPGINQLQTNKDIGLTFPRALRSFLRLDPDVILVGEIRDRETGDIAIEASLTGHLVLSTLHTNDAPSTVTRFVEMGVEPYMLSSSLLVICAQRLLRRLCPECKESYAPDAAQRRFVGIHDERPVKLFRPRGCKKCGGNGYKGRVGVHEVLAPDDVFRAAVNEKGVTAEQLKKIAVQGLGMTTLFWDAMEKVRQGLCSLPDALANVRPDEFDSRPAWMKEEFGA